MNDLQNKIEGYFQAPESGDREMIIKCVDSVFLLLNDGKVRVAEKKDGKWNVNDWVKKAILLAFKVKPSQKSDFDSFDKIDTLKYDYENPRYRKVPLSFIRNGVYIGDCAVIMPSYINTGVYIGSKTMVDMGVVIGSCAQIGANCHISALACIGGVLEPYQASPVIIEDDCFIGANSSILDGVIVEENSVIASGVNISTSTKIIDRTSGKVSHGVIPSGSVVVPGSYQSNGLNISCAVIVKRADTKTKPKVDINEFLRNS
ncbi:MAG: 2,3,4,5-tetrahydropyridine-2,6-dicarboxylate N-succinyltransferase [Holosporales bacterium]|jgi:2,3,4,5-tetrahydropyridine-2-carboxylate N-succinyltransferase|nr:2,3,4,5-tetrahydropyridine-2,6-dicarboxylate N-succinyltransferase [Holosporales bacterium]